MLERLWIYQRERFPLGALGLLALAVAASATMFAALARGAAAPDGGALAAAAGSVLLLFLQMRVLDEFKDFADDARYRPYRALPRGVVTFAELRAVLAAAAAGQVVLAAAIDPGLLALLAALWAYHALMTAEFFAPRWLRARPLAYLASHVPFGGLLGLYASAFEWLPRGAGAPAALGWFAAAALGTTLLLEVGRKIRAPQDEEPGVVTYSAAWGRPAAAGAWLAALALACACGWSAAWRAGHAGAFAAVMAPLFALGALACLRYVRDARRAAALEGASGLVTLALYAALGPLPMLLARP